MAFKKGQSGNPLGKAKGTKNKKSKQWEVLSNSITEEQAEKFNNYLNELWEGSPEDQYKASQLFLNVLKYFKPKMASIQASISDRNTVHKIIFEDA